MNKVSNEIIKRLNIVERGYECEDFNALAIHKRTGKLVMMINVYTGEHKKLSFKDKLKLLFK